MGEFYNCDCMAEMTKYPDKHFDLAIVDPPYGSAGQDFKAKEGRLHSGRYNKYKLAGSESSDLAIVKSWDVAPTAEYFKELFRISKNQVIWGGNYFDLPPTRCFLIWRKSNIPDQFTMSPVEYAWTSFFENAKVFERSSIRSKDSGGFHPTEKPVELYTWVLTSFAKPGDKILDTHVGSASSLIACERLGYDYVGYEINGEYYEKAKARLDLERRQIKWQF